MKQVTKESKVKSLRTELRKIGSNARHTFTGIFKKTGWKDGYRGSVQTILLLDIKDEHGQVVTDHLWFNFTRGFVAANPMEGDVLQFDARVSKYIKGYMGYRDDVYDHPIEEDYQLSRPTKVVNLTHPERMLDLPPLEKSYSKEEKDTTPTEKQLDFIKTIAEELEEEPPEIKTREEASSWIDRHIRLFDRAKQHDAYLDRVNQAKDSYLSGRSLIEVAEEMGLTVSTIRKYKREWETPKVTQAQWCCWSMEKTAMEKDELKEIFLDSWNGSEKPTDEKLNQVVDAYIHFIEVAQKLPKDKIYDAQGHEMIKAEQNCNRAEKGNDEDLDLLVSDQIYQVRVKVALRRRDKDLDILVHDPSANVRKEVAEVGRDKDLDILVNDKEPKVRAAVARKARPQDLDKLVNDSNCLVRATVATYGRKQDREALKNDKYKVVQTGIKQGMLKHGEVELQA